MSHSITKYKDDVTEVFGIGVEVLNGARSLRSISQDLKLLAFNGIVQASKIGSEQGKSLITLSGFLSDLPTQISPELSDLEELAGKLSMQITICSIAVRRFMLYTVGLDTMLKTTENKRRFERTYDLMDLNHLRQLKKQYSHGDITFESSNIQYLSGMNLELLSKLNDLLQQSLKTIEQSSKKIERIRRNGFIANYMGSNINIESSYITGTKQSFDGLVNNIRSIVEDLNEKLDLIQDKIQDGQKLLTSLIKSGLVQ